VRTLLDEQIIQSSLPDGWEYDRMKNVIRKDFVKNNFLDAVSFINKIAAIAERTDHHPDILLHHYKNILITYATHSAGGVTQMDIDAAREVNDL
jgi:4a-hydroxytetrahydrobiopterin dehydratase